ncbi:MAG: iron complex outermembrane receptor protein [Saprospiraceae bacterium]|jgi:iron complex outermembrane receptor protein
MQAFYKKLSFFLLLLFLGNTLFAQTKITGTVIDASNSEALIGVNILIKDAVGVGTVTDFDGTFSLEIPDEKTILIFSYTGYINQEVEVGSRTYIDVLLETDAEQLEAVVVTALGIKRQQRQIGYSTESLDGGEIALSNAPNIANALSGKIAGLAVTSGNGVDGGTTRFTIRGNNNITGDNQPLIVVDNVPISNDAGLTDIGRGQDWGSAINNINPNDIADITVLKGPTASALYGSRGGNGVILITTKKGGAAKGFGINYNVSRKVIQPFYFRDVQNTFGAGSPLDLLEPTFPINNAGEPSYPRDIYKDDGPYGLPTTQSFGFYSSAMSWGPRMEGQMIRWWDGEMRDYSAQPDNQKLYIKNGNTTNHNLSFSGNGKMGSMRVSLSRIENEAVVPNSDYQQTGINIGSRINVSKKATADVSVSYVNFNRHNSPNLADTPDYSFSKGHLYSWPRSYKGLERDINILPDGTQNPLMSTLYPFTYISPNIYWNNINHNTDLNRNKLIGNISLSLELTDWLTVTGRTGMDFTLNRFETKRRPVNNLGILGGYYSSDLNRDISLNNEFLISAHHDKIGGSLFSSNLSFGGTQWRREQYGLSASSGEWSQPWVYSLSNTADPLSAGLPSEIRVQHRINSLFGFWNIGYDDYLFLELTGRNDWSSTLPTGANSYFYPSASLSFIPTSAFDMSRLEWLTFWKLKGTYAISAKDAAPQQTDFVYSIGGFGGSQTSALPGAIPPLNLTNQDVRSYEVGTTIGLFNDKVNLDLTYYFINSFRQILQAPLPASSGANSITTNAGVVQNKGFEGILSLNLIKKRDFFWQSGFNIGWNRNKIIDLGEGADILELANIWGLNGPAIAVRAGEEYGTIIGYDYVYHEGTGKPILNEEGTQFLITENRVPIGNATPKFTGGWSMRMGYKGLILSTLVDTKVGGDIYAGSYVIGLQSGTSPETLLEREENGLPYRDPSGEMRNIGVILDGVYADGTQNEKVVHYFHKYIGNTGGWGRFNSKPGIMENTWVKLREVSLTYQIPEKIIGRTKLFQDLSINISGRDLFYIYNSLPDNINPEGSNGAGNAQGLEWAALPGMRSFTFGLDASF